MKDEYRIYNQKQTRDLLNYKTGVGATSGEIAFALLSLFGMKWANGTYKTYGKRWVSMGLISDAVTGAVGVGEDMTITFGSKVVSVATTPTVNAGDYLSITANDSNGASKKYHYLIVSVDTTNNTVTLDSPVMLPSGTVLVAALGTYAQAAADAANYAFDIIGLVPSDDWNGIDEYEVVDFDSAYTVAGDVSIGEPAAADTYVVQKLINGAGSPYQVYDAEFKAAGYRGVNSRTRWYDSSINPASEVDFAAGYGQVTIMFNGRERTDFQDTVGTPQMVNIYLADGGDQSTNFVAILDGFFGASGAVQGDDITSL
jgi:hypothetical protein